MVDINTAVGAAMNFAKSSLGPERTASIRLEEVETSNVNGTEAWQITLSNPLVDKRDLSSVRAMAEIFGPVASREYKTFTISKESGEVLAMKIRNLSRVA